MVMAASYLRHHHHPITFRRVERARL
jgi:hypothetical protein